DDALTFCRADGTPLVSDSGSASAEIDTAKFGSSPVASEVETSVLSQHATDAGVARPTGPTTVLAAPRISDNTRELSKPKPRKAIVALAVMVVAALATSAYFYLSRKNR